MTHPTAALPTLSDVRVVDLSRVLAGPFAGQVLAEMGADVVKVELPGGDPARAVGPHQQGRSLYYSSVNTGKRGVLVDPDQPGDRSFLEELLASADVVLHNFRPEAAASLSLRPDELLARHPHLVVVTISGYAAGSTRSGQGAYDVTIQAEAGVMSVTGEQGSAPARAGVPVSDLVAGLWAALGAVTGLLSRQVSGGGCHVEVPLLDATLPLLSYMATSAMASGIDPPKVGAGHHALVPYGAYPTRDGHVVIAVLRDPFWLALCGALGLDHLGARAELSTNTGRVTHRQVVDQELTSACSRWRTADLVARLEAAGVPVAPVNSVRDALSTDYVQERGSVGRIAAPEGGYSVVHGPLRSVDLTSRPAPALGEHDGELRRGQVGRAGETTDPAPPR